MNSTNSFVIDMEFLTATLKTPSTSPSLTIGTPTLEQFEGINAVISWKKERVLFDIERYTSFPCGIYMTTYALIGL